MADPSIQEGVPSAFYVTFSATASGSSNAPHQGLELAGDTRERTSLSPPMPADLDKRATAGFIYHYSTSVVKGSYDYLSLLCTEPGRLSPGLLYDAMECVGLAHLTDTRANQLSYLAAQLLVFQKHTGLIRSVNEALQDSTTAYSDETLAVVIILDLFEVCMYYVLANSSKRQKIAG